MDCRCRLRFFAISAYSLALAALLPSLHATIVGLNQIVTPDIQPTGVLSVSAQIEHPTIGNREELQLELGLGPRFEVGWFEGFKPDEGVFASELNLLQHGPHLLTAGVVNWSTRGGGAQPVLEYGYYTDTNHFVIGGIDANQSTEVLLGYRRQIVEPLSLSADFQSGTGNSTTVGFTYNLTSTISVNPALYYTNSRPHHLLGYVVFTWNLTAWK